MQLNFFDNKENKKDDKKSYRAIRHQIIRKKQDLYVDDLHHPNEKINQINNLNFTKMNKLRNSVTLIGNLGRDPEIITFESGKQKASFSMATKEVRKKENGEYITDTQWHNIVAWGKTAEIAHRILEKGSHVAIEGKLTNRSYEDKEGNKKYISEIILNDLLLIKSNGNNEPVDEKTKIEEKV